MDEIPRSMSAKLIRDAQSTPPKKHKTTGAWSDGDAESIQPLQAIVGTDPPLERGTSKAGFADCSGPQLCV